MEATVGTHTLSMANEDYLEAIWRIMLDRGDDSVRSVDVAELLGVSKASVNKALSTLKDTGYAEQNRYGRVALTDSGRGYAARVWRCHRALRAFLTDDLGVDEATADREACEMEHALSEDTMDRLLAYLEREGTIVDGSLDG